MEDAEDSEDTEDSKEAEKKENSRRPLRNLRSRRYPLLHAPPSTPSSASLQSPHQSLYACDCRSSARGTAAIQPRAADARSPAAQASAGDTQSGCPLDSSDARRHGGDCCGGVYLLLSAALRAGSSCAAHGSAHRL